jgi:hypothetical protein
VLHVHAPIEDKMDDIKGRFDEELDHEFDKFPKYHTKILLRNFSAEVGREDKPTTGNESLHKVSNEKVVRVVNFATSKILLSRVRCSHIVTLINLIGFLMGRAQSN